MTEVPRLRTGVIRFDNSMPTAGREFFQKEQCVIGVVTPPLIPTDQLSVNLIPFNNVCPFAARAGAPSIHKIKMFFFTISSF